MKRRDFIKGLVTATVVAAVVPQLPIAQAMPISYSDYDLLPQEGITAAEYLWRNHWIEDSQYQLNRIRQITYEHLKHR